MNKKEESVPDFGDSITFDFSENAFLDSDQMGFDMDFDNISPDEICNSTFHNQPIWRCATLIAPAPAPDAFANYIDEPKEYISRPVLKRDSSNQMRTLNECLPLYTMSNDSPKCNHTTAPEIPVLLMPTYFETSLPLVEVLFTLENFLKQMVGLSFTQNEFEWNIVYLNGPSHCKLQLHVYTGFTSGHIVEANKLNGDSSLFRSVYSQVKSELLAGSDELSFDYDSSTVFTPLPIPPSILTENPDTFGLGPIFRMAQSQFLESQTEASRTLCDLSMEESLRQSLCESGCVPILRELLLSTSEWAQHHATVALANLSDCWECQEYIVNGNVLPILLNLGSDGAYQYSEIRILAVYILANVSSRLASQVIAAMGRGEVNTWVTAVDGFADERLKLHGVRAREALAVALVN